MPGCKIKFELSKRKKTKRKATSTSPTKTSQPKLYSFVRLSFMRAAVLVDSRIETCFGFDDFTRLLEADDTAKWPTLCQHMDDLDASALHIVQQGAYARRKIAVSDKCRRGHDQSCCCR